MRGWTGQAAASLPRSSASFGGQFLLGGDRSLGYH